MNIAAVVDNALPRDAVPGDLLPKTLEALRAFVGLSQKTAAKPVDTTTRELFDQIAQIADTLFLTALEKRTASEFYGAAAGVFNNYLLILRAKADLLNVVLRNDMSRAEVLIHQSLSELEADFRQHGPGRFGAIVTEQALFTVWILRRTTEQIWRLQKPDIASSVLSGEQTERLANLSSDFALYSAWAQFHLGCLIAAMRLNEAVYPDVAPSIMDGLRAMVNANAYARQIMELYPSPVAEDMPADRGWDGEDEELLQSSMRDMASESDEL